MKKLLLSILLFNSVLSVSAQQNNQPITEQQAADIAQNYIRSETHYCPFASSCSGGGAFFDEETNTWKSMFFPITGNGMNIRYVIVTIAIDGKVINAYMNDR